MITVVPEISMGQIAVIAIPILSAICSVGMAYLFNRWKRETLEEVDKKLVAQKTTMDEKAAERQDAVLAAIADTNERLTRYAEGATALRAELGDFKTYADKHFVETADLAKVELGFQGAMTDLRDDVRTATATMSDVRDAVIALTAVKGKPTIPSAQRRRTAKVATV